MSHIPKHSPIRTRPAAKTDYTLKFYDRVLGLGYLHYGLWDADDPLTLEGLRRAQDRYADHLISLIPSGVKNILDVGCGTGGMALKLKQAGFEITGVSPDPYQKEQFKARTGCPFLLSRFQDLEAWPETDLILFAESAQYVPLDRFFPQCSRVLDRKGWVLVSDYFNKAKDGSLLTKSGHEEAAFRQAGENAGFKLVHEEDITARTAPTLRLVRDWKDRFALPALDLALEGARKRYPRMTAIILRMFRRRIEREKSKLALIDPDAFLRAKRYRIFLWGK